MRLLPILLWAQMPERARAALVESPITLGGITVSEQQKISDEAVEGLAYRLSDAFFASPARDEAHHERRWRELLREDERERYRELARAHLAAAYPLLRQQWEAESQEQNGRISAIVAESIAREIEGRIRVWPGMSQQAEAGNEHLRQAARIAREVGAKAGRPNGTEAPDA
jgi:hypothetical protein